MMIRYLLTGLPVVLFLGIASARSPLASGLLNQPPVAQNDENYDDEGIEQTGNVGVNDSDPNGDPLTYSVVEYPIHGTLVMEPDGSYSYLPEPEYAGFDYATYQVCDPSGACDEAVIEFAMLFLNDPPVALPDEFTVTAGQSFTGNVSANDYDVDIEPLFCHVVAAPAHAQSFSLGINGIFTYVPEAGFTGDDVFFYSACDPCQVCTQSFVTLHVTAPNAAPVAQNDNRTMSEDGSVSGTVAGNDSDPEGGALTFSLLTGPAGGLFTWNTNGSYSYSPDPDFFGTVTAIYAACDAQNACTQAVLTIQVIPVNDPPSVEAGEFVTQEDAPLQATVVVHDAENEALFFLLQDGPGSGEMEWYGDGTFLWTPGENFSGSDAFTFQVCDASGACVSETVPLLVMPVNDAPLVQESQGTWCAEGMHSFDLSPFVSDPEDAAELLDIHLLPGFGGVANLEGQILWFSLPAGAEGSFDLQYEVCDLDANPACTVGVVHIQAEQPASLSLTDVEITGITCHGDADGSVSAAPLPDMSGFEAVWEDGFTGLERGGLAAGSYTLFLSAPGCTQPGEAVIQIPGPDAPLSISGLSGIPISGTPGGSGSYEVNGGTPPYQFAWTGPDGSLVSDAQLLDGLTAAEEAGTYSVVVTDAHGCTAEASILITGTPENGVGTWSLWPNPAGDLAWLDCPARVQGPVAIRVSDLCGRTVMAFAATAGTRIPIHTEALRRGIYLVRIAQGPREHTLRLIVE